MRQLLFYATFLILILSGWSVSAQSNSSGLYVETSLFPVYVNRNDTRSVTTSPGVATESGLGYDTRTTIGFPFFGRSLLLGLTYNLYHLKTERGYIEGGDSGLEETTEHTQWGPTVGWLKGNWRFIFTYFTGGKKTVDSKNKDNTGTTGDVLITNTGVSGYQLAAGYTFQVSNGFGIGPSLVYRSMTYSKQSKVNVLNSFENYDEVDLASNSVEATLTAMVTLVFQF